MKQGKTVLLGLMIILAGCAAPRNDLIVGIYDAPREALSKLSACGFNLVTINAKETNQPAFLDAAAANGIGVIANPKLENPADRAVTQRLDRHRALWAWHLSDEPDLNLVSPEKVLALKRERSQTLRKPSFVVVGSGLAIEKYRDCADIIAVDWYPVPWTPLATISREMRMARLASDGRGFLAIVQAFDWSAFPEMMPGEKHLRAPTIEELRCMAFLSLFQGAKGLMFYSYEWKPWNIEENPAVWKALTNVVSEVREKGPVFKERVSWWPAQVKYVSDRKYNEIHEGALAVNLFRVREKKGSIAPGYYIVAINTMGESVKAAIKLSDEQFGDSTPHTKEWIEREYLPYEVALFGPMKWSGR